MDFFSPKDVMQRVNQAVGPYSQWVVKRPGVYPLCNGDRRFVLDCRTDKVAREIMELFNFKQNPPKGQMEKDEKPGKVWLTLDNETAHNFYDWVLDNDRTLRALVPPKETRPKRRLAPRGQSVRVPTV